MYDYTQISVNFRGKSRHLVTR